MTILVLLFWLSCGFAGAAEPTGIYGRVVNADTDAPVRRAVVLLTATGPVRRHVFTSAEGSFQFPATVAASDYSLVVQRDGYTEGTYRVKKASFEDPKEIVIKLRPQAVITGRVVDRDGQPLLSARIQALRISARRGAEPEVVATTESNDLGDYRLAGLDAGSYQIRVNYRGGRRYEFDPTPLTMASAFFGGGAGSPQPLELVVKAGSVTKGIDFTLNPAVPLTVRGKLHNDAGAVTQQASLWISGTSGEGGHNGQAQNGEFTISDVAPGSYTITAQTVDRAWFGVASVEVRSTDLADVDIVLKPVPRLEAAVRIEGGNPASASPTLTGAVYFIRTKPIKGMFMDIGKVDGIGKFALPLIPGEYGISMDESLSKMGVRSMTLDDKPITNWKVQIDDSPAVRKLVIVLGGSKP